MVERELVIGAVIMGIREKLMGYFKGSCVDNLSGTDNIWFTGVQLEQPSRNGRLYNYQRREEELLSCRDLLIKNVPILRVQKNPDRLYFYKELDRSEEFREVKRGIEKFMVRYLTGVKVEDFENASRNS